MGDPAGDSVLVVVDQVAADAHVAQPVQADPSGMDDLIHRREQSGVLPQLQVIRAGDVKEPSPSVGEHPPVGESSATTSFILAISSSSSWIGVTNA